MREVLTMAYKFKELPKEIQEKVIEKNREINLYEGYWDSALEMFHEDLKEYGIECKTFYFDIYDNSFYMDKPSVVNNCKLLEKAGLNKYAIMLEFLGVNIENNIRMNIYSEREHNEFEIDVDYYPDDTKIDEDIEKIAIELKEALQEYINELNHNFLKQLRDEEEYLSSDDAIKETIEINEYEFDESGEQI